jgi:hypothetical protein
MALCPKKDFQRGHTARPPSHPHLFPLFLTGLSGGTTAAAEEAMAAAMAASRAARVTIFCLSWRARGKKKEELVGAAAARARLIPALSLSNSKKTARSRRKKKVREASPSIQPITAHRVPRVHTPVNAEAGESVAGRAGGRVSGRGGCLSRRLGRAEAREAGRRARSRPTRVGFRGHASELLEHFSARDGGRIGTIARASRARLGPSPHAVEPRARAASSHAPLPPSLQKKKKHRPNAPDRPRPGRPGRGRGCARRRVRPRPEAGRDQTGVVEAG